MKIYIGHDPREQDAYEVCKHSIEAQASIPVEIDPISLDHPRYNRPFFLRDGQRYDSQDGKPFSTDFSFARFLVPHCENYEGWALFADCDFLFLADVAQLLKYQNPERAAYVVMHQHRPQSNVKMDNQIQSLYSRKNWSSLVLFNCGHPAHRALTVEAVNTRPGSWLHGFEWLAADEIGGLPPEWNFLVDYYPWRDPAELKAIHYTEGGPWFEKYRQCDYANLWLEEYYKLSPGRVENHNQKATA